MVPTGILPCVALGAALAIGSQGPGRDEGSVARTTVRFETERYELRVQGEEAEAAELARMLEVAWPTFHDFFGAEPRLDPGQRLRVELFDTREDCLRGAMDEKADMPPIKHPSWFSPHNRTVYAYRHESPWFTRYLVLYGACLQFHGLAKPKHIDIDAWYSHGIAESFAVHAWDGSRLRLATSPAVAWIDHPARAMEELGGKRLGLDPFTEERLLVPGVRWALVRFVLTGAEGRYRERFQKLALGLTGSKVTGEVAMRALAREPRIVEEFSVWLLANPMPMEMVEADWEELPDGRILARPGAEGLSLVAVKEGLTTLEATVTPPGDRLGGEGAIVLSLRNEGEYVQARPVPPLVFVEHVRAGRRSPIQTLALDAPRETVFLRAHTVGETAELTVDGKTFPPIEVPPGRVGLSAVKGPVVFERVRWH